MVLPNCQEEHQEEIQKLIEAKGSSYTVQGLPLTELLNPVFIEGFLKRGERRFIATELNNLFFCVAGKFFGLSIGKDPKAANCIVSISAEGTLHLSVDKEVFQSLRLEGKPVQSSRKVVDKYREYILSTSSRVSGRSTGALCMCIYIQGNQSIRVDASRSDGQDPAAA